MAYLDGLDLITREQYTSFTHLPRTRAMHMTRNVPESLLTGSRLALESHDAVQNNSPQKFKLTNMTQDGSKRRLGRRNYFLEAFVSIHLKADKTSLAQQRTTLID